MGRKNKKPKTINPHSSRSLWLERKKYKEILKKYHKVPEKYMTENKKNSVQWAKQGLKDLNRLQTQMQRQKLGLPNIKPYYPQCQKPKPTEGVDSEKLGTSTSTSSRTSNRGENKLSEQTFDMAIIDASKSDGAITTDNWQIIQRALAKVYSDVIATNPGPPPNCRDAGCQEGRIKVMLCADERSANLLQIAVGRLEEIWPGAMLQAIPKDQISNTYTL